MANHVQDLDEDFILSVREMQVQTTAQQFIEGVDAKGKIQYNIPRVAALLGYTNHRSLTETLSRIRKKMACQASIATDGVYPMPADHDGPNIRARRRGGSRASSRASPANSAFPSAAAGAAVAPVTAPDTGAAVAPVAGPATAPVTGPATAPVASAATAPVASTAVAPIADPATAPVVATTAYTTRSDTAPAASPAKGPAVTRNLDEFLANTDMMGPDGPVADPASVGAGKSEDKDPDSSLSTLADMPTPSWIGPQKHQDEDPDSSLSTLADMPTPSWIGPQEHQDEDQHSEVRYLLGRMEENRRDHEELGDDQGEIDDDDYADLYKQFVSSPEN